MIRLSQLENKQVRERKSSHKYLKVSDEEHKKVSDEELLAEGKQTSVGGHGDIEENISGAPVLEELCEGESNIDLIHSTVTKEAEVGEVGRPLFTKKMPLLKETCLHSEVPSPSFDLTTSESELSDDSNSSSSEDGEVWQETPDQRVGAQPSAMSNCAQSSFQILEDEEGEEEEEDTSGSKEVEMSKEEMEYRVKELGGEVMSREQSMKGGWEKSGRGFVWARGGVQGSLMMHSEVVELQ